MRTNSIRLLVSKRRRIQFSCPHYDQIKISPLKLCSCFKAGGFLETGKGGYRWGGIHHICALLPVYILLIGFLKGLYSFSNEN